MYVSALQQLWQCCHQEADGDVCGPADLSWDCALHENTRWHFPHLTVSLSLSLSFIFCWHLCFCELLADSFLMGHELYRVQWVVADDGPRDNSCLFSSSPFRFSSNNQRKQLSQTSSVNKVRSLRFCVMKISPFLTEKWLETVCGQCWHQCS